MAVEKASDPLDRATVALSTQRLLTLAATAQLAMNARSGSARPAQPAPSIQLSADTYVIAGIADLKLRSDLAANGTKGGALQALAHYLDSNPSARRQVVLAEEAA